MKITSLLSFLIIHIAAIGQNVGIGTAVPAPSAKLEIKSNNSGFLLPRMTTVERNLINSPATGLLIFNTDNSSLEMWNGNSWLSFGSTGVLNNGVPVGATCSNSWAQKADLPATGRKGAVAFSIGSKGYVGLGDDGTFKKDFYEYDPVTNTWTKEG